MLKFHEVVKINKLPVILFDRISVDRSIDLGPHDAKCGK